MVERFVNPLVTREKLLWYDTAPDAAEVVRISMGERSHGLAAVDLRRVCSTAMLDPTFIGLAVASERQFVEQTEIGLGQPPLDEDHFYYALDRLRTLCVGHLDGVKFEYFATELTLIAEAMVLLNQSQA